MKPSLQIRFFDDSFRRLLTPYQFERYKALQASNKRCTKKEMKMTNEQENSESNDQQPVMEDLTVNKDESTDVKGGVGGWGSSSYQYAIDTSYRY